MLAKGGLFVLDEGLPVAVGRLKGPERRQQVARVALELLAEVSPERLTTRRVAEAAGVTQPALFRHFASREEILAAAIDFARGELEQAMVRALPTDAPARATLFALVETLFDFTARFPGLPRLFFYRAAGGEALEAKPAAPLEALVAQLVRVVAAQLASAELPPGLDCQRAAELFIATLQGELLRGRFLAEQTQAEPAARAAAVTSLMSHWWAGLEAGQPAALPGPSPTAEPSGEAAGTEQLITLDARPAIEAGGDPFESAMAALDRLAPGGALVFTAPFRPTPLMSVMATRGFAVELLRDADPVVLVARGPELPALADLTDLEAPEPLEAVLLAAATLAPGDSYLARLPRHPALLLPRLAERGLAFATAPVRADDPTAGTLLHAHYPKLPSDG